VLPSLALAALFLGAPHAQSPHDEWRTLDTGHYRVHYPLAAEAWVLQAASRFEAIHESVVEVVGHDPDRKVDVVVMDPYGRANGFAMPLLNAPRMGVFPSPPGADSVLAHYHDWADDLVTHEDVHLVHMDRPSRNPVTSILTRYWLGVGPIALKTPMWAIEGYATMLEGQLTGAGRPHGPARAAYLRAMALEGRLPDYGAMNGSDAWQGGAAPYLVGSAFFEWLVEAHGEQSARDLWARLSARKIRFFDDAFEGVYGASPQDLYARFCAELTHRALSIEDQRPAQQGTLWQEFSRTTGAPAVSPEGARVAVVEDDEDTGRRILVLDIADNSEARESWQESVDELLAKDPEDVPALEPERFAHEELARFQHGARRPVGPRWLPGGEEILFTSWVRQADGDYLPELFIWDVDRGRTRRLTRGAGVQDADPHGGGSFAVAAQQRWGRARLVWVNLDDGAVSGITDWELDVVHDQPRIQPGGQHVAWLRHSGAWELTLRHLNDGTQRSIPLPVGSEPLHIAWEDADHIVLSLAQDGFVELVRQPIDGSAPTRLTQTATAAVAPYPTADGIFYLVPDSEGFDLHWLPSDHPVPADGLAAGEARVPAVPHEWEGAVPTPAATPFAEPPRDYGLGRAEWRPLIGANAWEQAGTTELGLRVGDVVGRWEAMGQVGLGGGTAPHAGSIAAAWRGLPVELRAQAFALGDSPVGAHSGRGGLDLGAGVLRLGDGRWGRVKAGVWSDLGWEEAEPYRAAGYASVGGGQRLWAGIAWLDLAAQIEGQHGTTRGAMWQRASGEGQLGLGWGPVGLFGTYRRDSSTGGGAMDGISLGGMHLPTLPDAWQAGTIALPALASGSVSGRQYEGWSASLDLERSMVVTLERHRLWSHDQDPTAATVLGAELNTWGLSNPMAKLPALDMNVGVGCVLESPEQGWHERPCLDKDHWSGWVGLSWDL